MQRTRYSYAACPKVLSNNSNTKLKNILKNGNVEKLEKLIRDGHGYKLMGEYSSDPKIRSILKAVPFYMARIDMIHDAVTKGHLRDLQMLMNITSPVYSLLKPKAENLVISKDNAGAGLLHKAVYYDYPEIIRWLVRNYPATVHVQDKLGRIPLHYIGSTTEPDRIWDLLVSAGSKTDLEDVNGRTPLHYLTSNEEIHLPDKMRYDYLYNEEITMKSSNIRIWIHDQDINRLQQIIWEGQGEKLKMQVSSKPLMKKFLDGVPYIMVVIQEVHKATVQNNVDALRMLCRKPVPSTILQSKDMNGLIPLHKACGLGHQNVVEFILETCPAAVHVSDKDGRTPAHYAAAFKQMKIYEKLLETGANENIIDKNGRTAKCYQSQPNDIDASLLHKMPTAPSSGLDNVYPSSFDWSILNASNFLNKTCNVKYCEFTSRSVDEATEKLETPCIITEQGKNSESESANNSQEIQEPERFINISVPVVEHEASNMDVDRDQDNDNSSKVTVECDAAVLNKKWATKNAGQTSANLKNQKFEDEIVKDNELITESLITLPKMKHTSCNTESPTISVFKRFAQKNTYDSIQNLKKLVDDMIMNEKLDEIGNFILEGYGELLLGAKSKNKQIQEFINHLPIYLKKIELIHSCCELGSYEELQKYLDRRKYATARESNSQLYLTPLHIATAYNHISIARYLVGRFPETLNKTDLVGRTPLHYASINPNGKYIYNVLLTLGADKTMKDNSGCSAEYYYEHPSDERYEELMKVLRSRGNVSKSNLNTVLMKSSSILKEITNYDKLESSYIYSVLSEALKTGLSAVIRNKPREPIKFLADYLYNYKEETKKQEKTIQQKEEIQPEQRQQSPMRKAPQLQEITKELNKQTQSPEAEQERSEKFMLKDMQAPVSIKSQSPTQMQTEKSDTEEEKEKQTLKIKTSIIDYEPSLSDEFQPLSRDKYGQTTIHYAAAHTHSRNAFLQMLKNTNGSVAYRDELYRTARDIATFSQLYENVKAIDEYILHIAANGESGKIMQLIIDGYDHILDTECDENITDIVYNRGHITTLKILQTIPTFEDSRDQLHSAIRNGNKIQIMQLMKKCGKDASLLATCRSYTFRCSLHIAVLAQKKDIIKYLVKRFTETLHVGDNLERTCLHYAMALDSVEELSSILIKAGAKRTIKDLKGRQPSYYFMDKTDIIAIQQDELY